MHLMKNTELKYGIYMFLGFVAFFFAMKSLGLYTNINLRGLNVLIHATFAFLAMRAFRFHNPEPFEFLTTFAVGFRTSLLGVLGFALFQFIYLQFLDPTFMQYIHENALMGSYLTPAFASIILVVEGLGVSIFASYVGMRLLTVKEAVPPLT
jgi:Protein of unknown function (DUF4199)